MILSAKTKTQPGNPDRFGLFFTNRALGLPPVQSTQLATEPSESPVPSPTGTSVITPASTQVVHSTPTPDLSALTSNQTPASSNNSFLGVGGGVLLSALIIIGAVIFGIWRVRSNR